MFSTHLNQPALQRWKEHSRPHYGGMRMRLTFSLLYILLYNSTSYGTAQQNGLTDICTRDLTLSHITCKQYRSHHVTWRRQLIRVSRFVMTNTNIVIELFLRFRLYRIHEPNNHNLCYQSKSAGSNWAIMERILRTRRLYQYVIFYIP